MLHNVAAQELEPMNDMLLLCSLLGGSKKVDRRQEHMGVHVLVIS